MAHLAKGLGIGNDQQVVDLAGNRPLVEPLRRRRAVRQFVHLRRGAFHAADIVLMADTGAVIGRLEFGRAAVLQLGFERLAGVPHDDETFAIDNGDMGVVGKFHRCGVPLLMWVRPSNVRGLSLLRVLEP